MSESFSVEIVPQGWRFDCAPAQTVLLAALEHGLRMPHSCRNGTCRACLAQLIDGQIDYRVDWPGLSAEEKGAGLILPCVACPRSPLKIAAPATLNLFDEEAPA